MSTISRPTFIANYHDLQRPLDDGGFADLGGLGSPLGGALGLTRLGINYEIVPPGSRSSFPHAESAEEEFVLIARGSPDVWIDGHLHPLVEGDAVAFPAGTGIAHNFLNNSDEDMHLFIVGEHQVAGNKVYYPIDEERRERFRSLGREWVGAPDRPLGPHDGRARRGTRGATQPIPRPDFIAHYTDRLAELTDAQHSNRGGRRSSLGAQQGLTRIGIHYDIVPPGNRTSRPHAESAEEEFVFVLKGRPDAWIDGELHPLVEGDAVAFPAGTGIAHSFLNNSGEDVHLVVVGEHERPGNKLYYPLNPDRMKLFARLGRAWDNAPKRPLGPHDGMAHAGTRRP